MPIIPIVSFQKFIETINGSIRASKTLKNDREYKIKVGLIGKQFKVDKWGKFTRNIDSELKDWISHIKTHFGEAWPHINNLTLQGFTDLTKGTASVIHAYAIHYRLHAELDRPQFARRIDEFVFGGETFEQSHGSAVFYKQKREEKQIRTTFAKLLTYPDAYQRGRKEFNEVKSALLLPNGSQNAVSVAICGAGGYGKSSLAQEICDDKGIQAAFSGGIYWLQFSLPDNSNENAGVVGLAEAVNRMLDVQYDKSERPPLNWDDKDNDILKLVKILPGERVLLVADDLGTPQQSNWLSRVPAGVSVLMTTRRRNIAKQAAHVIMIQRLTQEASYKLLTHDMMNISPDQQKGFQKIAEGFGGWPLLLGLANGVFKQRDGDPKARIDWSLGRFEQFLADDEIDAWDIPEIDEKAIKKRQKFVGFCIEAGLRAIHSNNNPDLLRKLAIFSADADIPFSVVIDYWAKIENKRISKTRGEALLRYFADFSFFSSFNEEIQSLRLHDEILGYFRASTSEDQRHWLHGELLASIQKHCSRGWETLPHNQTYGWTRLLHHLEKADRLDEADDLRTSFQWLKAKLVAVGPAELNKSFARISSRKDAQLVGRAINLSIVKLSSRPESLAHQLLGRLSHESDARLVELTQVAQSDPSYWPIPIKPHLPPIGLELLCIRGQYNLAFSAAFDQTGGKVVTASSDCTARLWDTETGAPIGRPLEGHFDAVTSVAFDPNGHRIVTASWDRTARLWDAETGTPIGKPFVGHRSWVMSAAFDPSGRKVVTASWDKTARLWDAETGAPIGRPLEGHRGFVNSAAFDPSGHKIVTASSDNTAQLWDAETGAPIGRPLEGHRGAVNSVAFDPSGRRIVTASQDGTARLWDAETSAPIVKPLHGHAGPVNSVAFDPSGRRIVTASSDGTARLWDAETGAPIGRPLEGHGSSVNSVAFDQSGSKIVTVSSDGTARLWDAEMNALVDRSLEWHRGAVNSVAFDPSGRRVVTASQDGTARLWDVKTGAPIGRPLEGHDSSVDSAAFDPSGRRIVTASSDGTARLWDAETGAPIGRPLKEDGSSVDSAAFDPSGRKIVTVASSDCTARLWDAETGAPIGKPLKGHRGFVMSAAFDPSGRRIVTASWDKTARIWDAETGAPIVRPLEGHHGSVKSAAFDPSGRRIVTASHDGTARLWDAETGALVGRPLEGHGRFVSNAAFDRSGRRIVTASPDGTAQLWDAETGVPIGTPLEGHCGSVTNAAFDRSGLRVVTTSSDGTARLWNAETGACWATIDFDATPLCVDWHHEYLAVGLRSGFLCLFLTARE